MTDMGAAFLVLLLWAVACAHPVPGHEPTHPSTLLEEADAHDTDDDDNGGHYSTGVNGFSSHSGGFLDEEDDSGDDTFDANGEKERGEGPAYVAGIDGAGENEHNAGREDAGAGGAYGDSSSSSSESTGSDHWRYRNYGFGRTYRHGGATSSSQEEESYDFQDETMQGDDPSVFDSLDSSYRLRHAGPHAPGNSWENVQWVGSHQWEEGDSRSPEVGDGDSGEDSPSVEDNSQSEEPVDSQSEEKSSSHSKGDGDDSPSREDEDSKSREGIDEQSDEELRETLEVVKTLNEHSNSQTWEGQVNLDSAEDRRMLSTPDSESREEEGEWSKSREDDDDKSQSTEDTVEESEDDNDSGPSTSAESPESSEDDSSPEDNTGEESRSTESDNSESQEDDYVETHSQEEATRESSSHRDGSSLQSLESGGRKWRLSALHHRPAADYDDNDCQDGY